ncbi:uncharacterized protein NEMAJ01_2324 [Nematocida major]|uniref:uncharacterized protein n=1 Tax=Nematocida major TaxID=1912982 RepID=UPI002007523C|nr:uncharacterized protein NEMAJ01_2324 [Nematocida major]KAH9387428.1 hypothetical protein NEMAJ01_2324 [Nematocida major]
MKISSMRLAHMLLAYGFSTIRATLPDGDFCGSGSDAGLDESLHSDESQDIILARAIPCISRYSSLEEEAPAPPPSQPNIVYVSTQTVQMSETPQQITCEVELEPEPSVKFVLDSPETSDDAASVNLEHKGHGTTPDASERPNPLSGRGLEDEESLETKRQAGRNAGATFMFCELEEFPAFKDPLKVQALLLYNCKFSKIPDSIGELKELHSITISNCEISKISDSISHLNKLSILHIVNCTKLERLPEGLFQCHALKDLQVTSCRISHLPCMVGVLSLVKLNLSRNLISDLPDTLGSMSKLEVLNISHNKLEQIPLGLCDLASLKELDLSHNIIFFTKKDNIEYEKMFTPTVKKYYNYTADPVGAKKELIPLPSLVEANLSNNLLEYIPTIFFASQYIKALNFSNNKLVTVDKSVDRVLRRARFNKLDLQNNTTLEDYGDLLTDCGCKEIFWLFNDAVLLSDSILKRLAQPTPKNEAYRMLALFERDAIIWNYAKLKTLRRRTDQSMVLDPQSPNFNKDGLKIKIGEYLLTLKNNVFSGLFTFPARVGKGDISELGEYWTYVMRDEVGPGNSRLWACISPKYPFSLELKDPFFNSIGNAILAFYTRFSISTVVSYIQDKINSEYLSVRNAIKYAHLNSPPHKYNDLFQYKVEDVRYAEVTKECVILLLRDFGYIVDAR